MACKMERPTYLGSPEEAAERNYQEASSTADLLKNRMLECMRAAESVLQQRERYRRRPNAVNHRDVVHAVLAHVTLDQLTASCLIRALAKTAHAHLSTMTADWLLETQPGVGGSSSVLHAAILAAATSNFNPDTALRFLQLRDSYGLPPCLESTNMAITACSHCGRVEDALRLVEGMAEHGLSPTPYTIIMTLQAANFKRRGGHKEALRALACLPRGAPLPSAVVDAVLSVFEAAMHKAGTLDEVQDMFRELEDVRLSDSTRAYNAVLQACASRGEWQLARSYFDRMTAEDVPADTNTFNALILSCVKGQALDVAFDIFEWLVSGREVTEPIPADITTYNTLIKACHQAGLLEKALEIASWVLNAGVQWDSTTFTELMSTVEVAQLWDTKVVNSPFYQLIPFSEAGKGKGGAAAAAAHIVSPPRAGSHDSTPGQERSHVSGADLGGMSLSGHPGYSLSSFSSSVKVYDTGLSSSSQHSLPGAPPPRPKTPPMVPLAIFPDQLRPAPFDGLRMMYLDQLKELEEEALLAAIKLNDTSWAARTLMRGGTGTRGKGTPTPIASAAAAMHGHGAFTVSTEGRATRPALPKLPRIMAGANGGSGKSDHVVLSPAPSFRNMSLDNVSRNRLDTLQSMVEGSPRKQQLASFTGANEFAAFTPKSPHSGVYAGSIGGAEGGVGDEAGALRKRSVVGTPQPV